MPSKVPSQSFIPGALADRFQSELTLQKLVIWQLSGLLEVYGGPAADDYRRERVQNALIEELAGLLLKAVTCELADRQSALKYGRSVGRPKDVITPYLAPELLSVFLRYNYRAGRQSFITSVDGKIKQIEAGRFFCFIGAVIQPLNQYLSTEFRRRPLSAARLARFALAARAEQELRE